MTELDRVGNSDNYKFKGFPSFLQVCEKGSQATRKKSTMMVLLYIYSKISGVRLPICPVISKNLHTPARVIVLIECA